MKISNSMWWPTNRADGSIEVKALFDTNKMDAHTLLETRDDLESKCTTSHTFEMRQQQEESNQENFSMNIENVNSAIMHMREYLEIYSSEEYPMKSIENQILPKEINQLANQKNKITRTVIKHKKLDINPEDQKQSTYLTSAIREKTARSKRKKMKKRVKRELETKPFPSEIPTKEDKEKTEDHDIQEMIKQVAAIESVLNDISKARNVLEKTCLKKPEEIPLTIFTVKKASKTSSERAGERLHRQAMERQKRIEQRKIRAYRGCESPTLAKRSPRGDVCNLGSYPDKFIKEATATYGTEVNSVHTASTKSCSSNTKSSASCSVSRKKKMKKSSRTDVKSATIKKEEGKPILKTNKSSRTHDESVYSRLYDCAKAQKKRINDKTKYERSRSAEISLADTKSSYGRSVATNLSDKHPLVNSSSLISTYQDLYKQSNLHTVKGNVYNCKKLQHADEMYQKCLEQLARHERSQSKGSDKTQTKFYKNRFTTAVKTNYLL